MSRFNKSAAKAEKVRVCVYCDPDLYQDLKCLLAMQGETVTSFFEKYATAEVSTAKRFVDAIRKSRVDRGTEIKSAD